ncbi:MAG: DUF4394 domain-containing protein [Terrimicrobiaceae bacterium]|nr:DUF4394 domain-containing protein [Terrimicrobiaceae bacterium]
MKRIAVSLLSLLSALSLLTNAKAITCYALTDTSHLLVFDSSTPGTVTDKGPVSGIGGDTLVGIDIRTTVQTLGAANPGVGSLWAIGRSLLNFHLYVINPATAAATQIGGNLVGINNGAGDNGWGFGFDPTLDRIRFIGFQSNYLIDPNTATFVQQGNVVAAGNSFPAINGAAYTTASFGGTSQLYSLDDGLHVLLISSNPASGVLSQVGAGLGPTNTQPNGFDIFQGTALWAGSPGGTAALYSVNLSSGAATLIGNIFGNPTIRGLAIVPTSFPPVLSVTVKIKGPKNVTTTGASLVVRGTASSQSGIKLVQYKIGKGKFKKARGTTKWKFTAQLKPGVNTISVRATGGNDVSSALAKVKVTRQ